jgi:hypothetical protein
LWLFLPSVSTAGFRFAQQNEEKRVRREKLKTKNGKNEKRNNLAT